MGVNSPAAALPATAGPPSGRRRLLTEARLPLLAFAASRLFTLLVASIAAARSPELSVARILAAWDVGWYLRLIEEGYPAQVPEIGGKATWSTIAFFPGYPVLARAVSRLPLVSDFAAAMSVSLAFGALSAVLLWTLARAVAGRATADRAVTLYCLFPGSAVLSMAYSEAVLLPFAIGCLLALLRRRWVVAGSLGAAATLTRPNGIALVAASAWAAGAAIRERRDWRALWAVALAPLGILTYFAFLWLHTGEFGAWFRVEREGWGHTSSFDNTIRYAVWFLNDPLGHVPVFVFAVSAVTAVVGLGILARRRWPDLLVIYSFTVLAISALRIDSVRPRDLLMAFPLLIGIADAVSRPLYWALLVMSLAGTAFLLVYHALPGAVPP